jgi:23S rRNA pseudouridine1911/1915/1917 synthase
MKRIVLIVDAEQAGRRLDQFLTAVRPELSRGEVQRDIRAGTVSISGKAVCQPSRRLHENDEVVWDLVDKEVLTPHPMTLDILHEDDHLVVVDKPPGLVVHPGAGTDAPTLVEGLLSDRTLPPSDDPARPGVVHRLDKETSGVIVVAKTPAALAHLQRQFAERAVAKSYIAVVSGIIREEEGTIDAPIGRDPTYPRRMSIHSQGRAARTDFRVLRRFEDSTLLHAQPRTGRTHQLRVHFRYTGHPVLGDTVYGNVPARRLLLHAWRITLRHPATDEVLRFEAPVPPGFPSYPFDELPWSDSPDLM